MDKISVIIPTKDRIQDVIACLEHALVQTLLPDEILVVDGSDTDKLNAEIKLRFSEDTRIRYISSKPGLTHQRNVGIDASFGDITVFIDDDVILDKDCLKEIMHVFKTYPKDIGGVTVNLIEKYQTEGKPGFWGKIKDAIARFLLSLFFLTRWGNGKFQPSGFPTLIKSGSVDKIIFCESLFGSCMAFRRELFDELRFNEDLYQCRYAEDDEFAYRLSRKYKSIYTPHAKAIHNRSQLERNRYIRMKGLMINHLCHFRKNLPQDLKHSLAFYWSVIGLFLAEAVLAIAERNSGGLKGLWEGMGQAREIKASSQCQPAR
jgi:GT2 family glycosyltransferase